MPKLDTPQQDKSFQYRAFLPNGLLANPQVLTFTPQLLCLIIGDGGEAMGAEFIRDLAIFPRSPVDSLARM